jgi:hypothetical protein
MEIINGKLNVKLITKSRLFEGEKGTYLNFTLVPTPTSQYGDYMIVEDITKEERLEGKKGVILGNCKVFKRTEKPTPEATVANNATTEEPDGLPF